MLLQQGLTRSFDFRFQLMRSILLSTSLRAIGLNGAGIMEVANLGAQVDEGVDASLREGTMRTVAAQWTSIARLPVG